MVEFFYHSWTPEEERELSEIMASGLKNRKKLDELLREASTRLNRTKYSCQNRWYDIKNRNKAV